MLNRHTAVLAIVLLVAVPQASFAKVWGCHGTKPGHPTPEERSAFIREASELALAAEKAHGVPASALAALAIAESGYGWTRVAINANNLFAWKYVRAAADGRKSYLPACHLRRGINNHFVVFKSRADAFDFVSSKLATLDAYRQYTDAYNEARKRGDAVDLAVNAWLTGIAAKYSHKPEVFRKKIVRIMNNPAEPADKLSPESNLYQLSAIARGGR
jgi:uncharacterized FlgJ-related protein